MLRFFRFPSRVRIKVLKSQRCLLYLLLANRILYLDKGAVLVERVLGVERKIDVNVMEFTNRGRINVE